MDELTSIKQALSFLLEQENIRQQEIAALNEKIEGLSSSVNDRVKEFSGWVDDREYKDFSDKYGDRLSPYADKMKKIHGDDFDFNREVYNTYDPEAYENEDEYIDATIGALDKYLEDIGIPKDVAVEVKADMDGDGVAETVVDTNTDDVGTDVGTDSESEDVKSEDVKSEEDKPETEPEADDEKRFMDSVNAAVDKELANNKK